MYWKIVEYPAICYRTKNYSVDISVGSPGEPRQSGACGRMGLRFRSGEIVVACGKVTFEE